MEENKIEVLKNVKLIYLAKQSRLFGLLLPFSPNKRPVLKDLSSKLQMLSNIHF